jgi:hypothetical protein
MALIKCDECAREVSDTAPHCPGCGAKVRKPTSRLTLIIGGFILVAIGSSVFSSNSNSAKPAPQKTPQQLAAEAKKEAAFQRTADITRQLKAALRDPESVQWESIRANDDASLVCLQYRARNGFGGMNREVAIVQGNKVSQRAADWNKHCTQPLTDMHHVRLAL